MPAKLAARRRRRRWSGYRGRRLGRWRRCGCLEFQQFRDSDELEAFGFEPAQRLGHRLDRLSVNIMSKHDSAGMRLLENPTTNDTWTRSLPIERIDLPQNNFVTQLVMDKTFLVLGER